MTARTPAQYDWKNALFNDRRLSKHFTHPRRSKITHVTLHHMTIVVNGSGSGTTAALEACYRTWQAREASANYGVSGDQVWQYVGDGDASWSDANNASNHSTLSIEHANSTGSPSWQISDETMATGQRLVASLHLLYKLGRPTRTTVKVHRDFYATDCPGPYMMARLDEYIASAGRMYDSMKPGATIPTVPSHTPEPIIKNQMDPRQYFLGAKGDHITWLGGRLVIWAKALKLPAPYKVGPGSSFTETDRKAVAAFQRAQGWTGAGADGYPGALTLARLAADPVPKQPATVSIVSWNILGANHTTWPGARSKGVCGVLTTLPVDVIATQECNLAVQWNDISRALGKGWTHVPSLYSHNSLFFNNRKYRLTRPAKEYFLCKYQNRHALVVHLQDIKTGVKFTCVNTHMPSASTPWRIVAARALVKLLKQVDDPIILTGDMNNSSEYVGGPRNQFRRAGFIPMREQSDTRNKQYASADESMRPVIGKQWIDGLFTKPAEAKVFDSELVLNKPGLSDHLPLLARIRIPA